MAAQVEETIVNADVGQAELRRPYVGQHFLGVRSGGHVEGREVRSRVSEPRGRIGRSVQPDPGIDAAFEVEHRHHDSRPQGRAQQPQEHFFALSRLDRRVPGQILSLSGVVPRVPSPMLSQSLPRCRPAVTIDSSTAFAPA